MRLLSLTINNFRGFGPHTPTIRFDGDLLLFYGPNGFGKTSVAEAIEWLFYGTTKRRQRGDTYSRSEYAGTFGNVHGGRPVQVEASVLLNGSTVRLCRRLTDGESSETLVDGVVAPFSAVGVNPIEAVYPVVAQHGLQTFIHAKPKDRRDAISAALGLDELTSLKSALDSARTSFQRTPPRPVTDARRELAANLEALGRIAATAPFVTRWRATPMQISVDADLPALLHASESLTGQTALTTEAALEALRARRAVVSRSVFDVDILSPFDDHAAGLAIATTAAESARDGMGAVERAIAASVAAIASSYNAALLELWSKGLEVAPAGDKCPVCEADTFTDRQKNELRKRLAAAAESLSTRHALQEAVETAARLIVRAKEAAARIQIGSLTPADREHLTRLYADAPEPLNTFLVHYDQLSLAAVNCQTTVTGCQTFLAGIIGRLADAANAPSVTRDSVQSKDTLASTFADLAARLPEYVTAWQAFEPTLTARIASNEVIANIDAVGKTLTKVAHMRVLERYDQILSETQELIRAIEASIQSTQTRLLATRGTEVKVLYDRLNRGANVGFDVMEPGTDSMKLYATSFGVRMSAAANLSECQLNCVGLSMWLMRATTPTSPFGFIMLDDPVQAMDDDHAEAFIADIVPHLMDDHGKQIIVLSHVKRVTDRLRELNQNRRTRLYHLETFDRAGPTITEQIRLRMLLSEIKGAARGNESNREYAVDRLRVLIEHFVREAHLQITGQPAPSRFDRSNASQLLPLFQTLSGTTQQEHAGLRDTVGFCDPAHHTEVGYSTPLTSNIQPHIDRLETLLNKYNL
jgi:hypothetical protein